MGIIGNNVVLGFGDVLISGKVDQFYSPTTQIRFSQLMSADATPDHDHVDHGVVPVTLTMDLAGLEKLNFMTNDILSKIYDRQAKHLESLSGSLQTQDS